MPVVITTPLTPPLYVFVGLQSVQRPCRRHRLRALLHRGLITSRQSYFVPQCDKDGFYLPLQCLVRDQRCWCVDKHGKEIAGTRRRGTVHCEAEVKGWYIDFTNISVKVDNQR